MGMFRWFVLVLLFSLLAACGGAGGTGGDEGTINTTKEDNYIQNDNTDTTGESESLVYHLTIINNTGDSLSKLSVAFSSYHGDISPYYGWEEIQLPHYILPYGEMEIDVKMNKKQGYTDPTNMVFRIKNVDFPVEFSYGVSLIEDREKRHYVVNIPSSYDSIQLQVNNPFSEKIVGVYIRQIVESDLYLIGGAVYSGDWSENLLESHESLYSGDYFYFDNLPTSSYLNSYEVKIRTSEGTVSVYENLEAGDFIVAN